MSRRAEAGKPRTAGREGAPAHIDRESLVKAVSGVTVLLIGVRMAVLILDPPEAVMSWTDSIVQTVAIFAWTVAGLRVVSLVCGSIGGAVRRSEWIDASHGESSRLPLVFGTHCAAPSRYCGCAAMIALLTCKGY